MAEAAEIEVILERFRNAVESGTHWFIALLHAMREWPLDEEVIEKEKYTYLIAGEALDWQLLSERICETAIDLISDDEKHAFLRYNIHPLKLPTGKFRQLIGEERYRQYLNYFYGVMVEEALYFAVQDEVRKAHWAAGYRGVRDYTPEIYHRIYETSQEDMMKEYRKARKLRPRKTLKVSDNKDFAYWRFKYRFDYCDKAKVASDTRKALDWLENQRKKIDRKDTVAGKSR